MGNLFVILETETMTELEWQLTKKMDKNDHLIFMVPTSGMLPYQVLPYFLNLKSEPDIFPFADADPLALSFFLGSQCSGINNGKCYIITSRNDLYELDDTEFILEKEKFSVKISVFSNLEDAISDKKEAKTKKVKTSAEKVQKETAVKEENKESVDEVSSAFSNEYISLLRKYSTSSVNLVKYQDVIAKCAMNATEGVLSTFEFQLSVELENESLAEEIAKLLEDHIEEIKSVL